MPIILMNEAHKPVRISNGEEVGKILPVRTIRCVRCERRRDNNPWEIYGLRRAAAKSQQRCGGELR